MTIAQDIPYKTISRILEFLAEDFEHDQEFPDFHDLRSASLVARAWIAPAQEMLLTNHLSHTTDGRGTRWIPLFRSLSLDRARLGTVSADKATEQLRLLVQRGIRHQHVDGWDSNNDIYDIIISRALGMVVRLDPSMCMVSLR